MFYERLECVFFVMVMAAGSKCRWQLVAFPIKLVPSGGDMLGQEVTTKCHVDRVFIEGNWYVLVMALKNYIFSTYKL